VTVKLIIMRGNFAVGLASGPPGALESRAKMTFCSASSRDLNWIYGDSYSAGR
jgi:hypothetical protein